MKTYSFLLYALVITLELICNTLHHTSDPHPRQATYLTGCMDYLHILFLLASALYTHAPELPTITLIS